MNIRKSAIATIATLAVISATMVGAPNEAQAGGKHFAAGILGGLIVGGIVANARARTAPVYSSCYTQWETQYDAYGNPYSVKVRYCN